MLCAISGEAPQEPVVSKKSGNVFEKRLIEAYVADNGRDPVTNEELTSEDLLELKSSRTVKPRPPTLTSIPSLLTTFQNEWDALVLETYTLRQQLAQTRQELSTALYQNDAAVRVIARLTKERDESREALSRISISGGSGTNGDSMQVDRPGLSQPLLAKIDETREKLSSTRRKRPVPDGWATADTIESFKPIVAAQSVTSDPTSFSLDEAGELALFGAKDGSAGVFSLSTDELVHSFKSSGGVSSVTWSGSQAVVASKTGTVQIFVDGEETKKFSGHAGAATAVCAHPSGALLASVGVDKSFIFYDLEADEIATQVFTNSALSAAAFHPDGHLFAAGGTDGDIKLFDVKSGASAADFTSVGPIRALAFSENGTWLASISQGQTTIQIWDLRKASQIKTLEIGSPVDSIEWDYTGQFLLVAGPSGISVQQYSKAAKEWSEPLKNSVVSVAAGWGAKAGSIAALGEDGSVTKLSE